jgi:hypothetical protein
MQQAPTTIVHAGYTVLRAAADGWIDTDPAGLFDYDTRILSRYRLTIDGLAPELVGASQPEADTYVARYRVPRGKGRPEGPLLPQDAIEVDLERVVGSGMRERWIVRNHSAVEWAGMAWLELDADFADIAEVGRERRQKGDLSAEVRGHSLELRYRARRDGRRFDRAVRVRVQAPRGTLETTSGGFGVRLVLGPRDEASFEVRVSSRVGGRWRSPAGPESLDGGPARQRASWRTRRMRIDGPDRLRVPFERAVEDLYSLRNADLEHDLLDGEGPLPPLRRRGWIVNAGVPTFTG